MSTAIVLAALSITRADSPYSELPFADVRATAGGHLTPEANEWMVSKQDQWSQK